AHAPLRDRLLDPAAAAVLGGAGDHPADPRVGDANGSGAWRRTAIAGRLAFHPNTEDLDGVDRPERQARPRHGSGEPPQPVVGDRPAATPGWCRDLPHLRG